MNGDGIPVRRRAELYLRSLWPDGYCARQSSILDRLDGLEERGVVVEHNVQVCGCQVPATRREARTEVGERLVGRISTFRAWAIRNDCSLTPGFEIREVDNSLTGEQYRAVRLPAILLAEYDESGLVCVTPHRDGESVRTVADRVAELETGEPTRFEPVVDRDADPAVAGTDGSDAEPAPVADDDPTDEGDLRTLLPPR